MMKLLEILTKGSEKQIQDYISSRFINNMEFFKYAQKGLFEELKLPPKTYNLIFDRGINILDLNSNKLLYPLLENQSTMVETHLEISTQPLSNARWKIHSNEIFLNSIDEKKLPITAFVVNTMIKILKKHQGTKHYHLHPKFMPSTTLYGLFGGLFLEFLREEGVFFHSLLIFEENIDLFRISCYFVDFEKLFCSNKACYLFVKNVADRRFIRNFFATRKITSNFLLCELQMYSSPKIAQIQSWILQEYSANKRGWGSFEDEIIGLINTLKNQKTPLLASLKRFDIPICVIGNGPSLDSLLPSIKQNEEKMLIFSCGTALKPLKNYGIKVDFQIEIERIDYLADVLLDAPLGDTCLLCGNMVNPKALSLAKEKYLFLRGGSSGSYIFKTPNIIELASPFVGNAGVALAMLLGKEILLCGIDCAYVVGESKHSQKSYYGNEDTKIPDNVLSVRPNKDKAVFADSVFLLSLQNITEAIRVFKPKNVYNLGYGAFIEGAMPIDFCDLHLKNNNKTAIIKAIKTLMQECKIQDNHYFISQARNYLKEILGILSLGARNKKELFALVDRIFVCMAEFGVKNPHLAILFEGSIGHILQNLLLASLHLPNDDIYPFYQESLEYIILGFERMLVRYMMILKLHLSE